MDILLDAFIHVYMCNHDFVSQIIAIFKHLVIVII